MSVNSSLSASFVFWSIGFDGVWPEADNASKRIRSMIAPVLVFIVSSLRGAQEIVLG
jgi:hypothetical protein